MWLRCDKGANDAVQSEVPEETKFPGGNNHVKRRTCQWPYQCGHPVGAETVECGQESLWSGAEHEWEVRRWDGE